MDRSQLQTEINRAALAFRGYNVTNLGRSTELLAHPAYGPSVRQSLDEASRIASDLLSRPIDLVGRVERHEETSLETYDEAIAVVLAMSNAQLHLLREWHGIEYAEAMVSMGYSLGEIGALVAGEVLVMESALAIPLSLAADCAALAEGVRLGVLFCRGESLAVDEVQRLCITINARGEGVIGVSSYLSPNSLLLMGQGETLSEFRGMAKEFLPDRSQLRFNNQVWPPLHTPITWARQIPDRASFMMHQVKAAFAAPRPQVLSLVTGEMSYDDLNTRLILRRWIDQPQRLWDGVYGMLSMGVETVIHVGPQPNIIPATFRRLSDNVEAQTRGKIGMRALSSIVRRGWLQALLPQRTALLRAPSVNHVILEDWLLENAPD